MTYKIAYLFADVGVEAEVLSRVGDVTRYTIDPHPNTAVSETVRMDLMEDAPERKFDFAFLQPRCTDKSQMTSINGDPTDHENQIPRAREIARSIADNYAIENKPRDDLRNPTRLNGRMFGLPISYERAFETTFTIRGPPKERRWDEKTVSPYFYSDRSHRWWKLVKGYSGDYLKEHLAKNALPAVYVETILRSWLETLETVDSHEVQDNSSRPPRSVASSQLTLVLDAEPRGDG